MAGRSAHRSGIAFAHTGVCCILLDLMIRWEI
jgi:hypothetical protein